MSDAYQKRVYWLSRIESHEYLLIFILCVMFFFTLASGISLSYADDTVVATVPVGRDPQGIAVDTINNMVCVVNLNSNSVSVIDGSTLNTFY
jgi:hypothetical protein